MSDLRPDTFAASHLPATSLDAGESSITEYEQIRGPSANTSVCAQTGTRLKLVTGDKLELIYLLKRLSITIQRGNELCFNGTFVSR